MPSADRRQRKKDNARAAREARLAAEKRRKRNRTIRNGAIGAAVLILAVVLLNVLTGDDDNDKGDTTGTTIAGSTATAKIETNFGDIELSLDTKNAPKASERFIKNAKDGVYDGSRWHRIVKDFVIQGGAPGGDPAKDVGDPVIGELPTDHYPVGSLAAAKTADAKAGTFDSQFFIVTGEQQGASLPNEYARFGGVSSGMDVVRKIEALTVDDNEQPNDEATIDKVTITES